MTMNAEQLVQSGDLDKALSALQNQVRDDPSNSSLRIFLFQLLCVGGDWNRALTQMSVSSDLDSEAKLMAQAYAEVIQCEVFREAVFAGEKQPLIFGEPAAWVADQLQVLSLAASGQGESAFELALKVSDAAPSTPGTIDDQAFDWMTDGDMRIGPMIEAIINGKYYWVPMMNIESIEVAQPVDLRDLVWAPVAFKWKNEGETHGFIPARYPLSDQDDSASKLSRRTAWQAHGENFYSGVGQRMFCTDKDEYSLLDCRKIQFSPRADEA